MHTDTTSPAATTPGWRRVSWRLLGVLVFVAVMVALPFGLSNFWLRVMTTALMYAGLGHGMQVIFGLAGWPALGNVVFFGVGAYVSALLSVRLDVPALLAVPAGGLAAALLALAAARAMLSLRGSYFLMATVALNFAMLELTQVARDITNGPQGVTLSPIISGSPQFVYSAFYFIFLGVLGVSALVLVVLRRSRLGYGLLAIRGNEDAALMLGVPTFRYKAVAWAISAFLTGAIGAIYAFWIGYIDPESVFDLLISLGVILMVLLGGRLLVFGPILGGFAFVLLDDLTRQQFNEARLLALGAALVIVVRFLPGGLPELYDHAVRLVHRRATKEGQPDAA